MAQTVYCLTCKMLPQCSLFVLLRESEHRFRCSLTECFPLPGAVAAGSMRVSAGNRVAQIPWHVGIATGPAAHNASSPNGQDQVLCSIDIYRCLPVVGPAASNQVFSVAKFPTKIRTL